MCALLGVILPASAQDRSDEWSDEQVRDYALQFSIAAAQALEHLELTQQQEDIELRRLAEVILAYGDDRVVEDYIEQMGPRNQRVATDYLIRRIRAGTLDPRRYNVDAIVDVEDPVLKIARLTAFLPHSAQARPTETAARAMQLLEAIIAEDGIPERGSVFGQERHSLVAFNGRDDVLAQLARAQVVHGRFDSAFQTLSSIAPHLNEWRTGLAELVDAQLAADDLQGARQTVSRALDYLAADHEYAPGPNVWFAVMRIQERHDEPAVAAATLARMRSFAAGLDNIERSTYFLVEIAKAYHDREDHEAGQAVFDQALQRAALSENSRANDYVAYTRAGLHLIDHELEQASAMVARIQDHRTAMVQARNVIALAIRLNNAEQARAAYDLAVQIARDEDFEDGWLELRQLSEMEQRYLQPLEAGQLSPPAMSATLVYRQIRQHAYDDTLDQVPDFFESQGYNNAQRLKYLNSTGELFLRAQDAEHARALLRMTADMALTAEFTEQMLTLRPPSQGPYLQYVMPEHGVGGTDPTPARMDGESVGGGVAGGSVGSSSPAEIVTHRLELSAIDSARMTALSKTLRQQLLLGLFDDAIAIVESDTHPRLTCLAGMVATLYARQTVGEDLLAPFMSAVVERAGALDNQARLTVYISLDHGLTGDPDINHLLRVRLPGLVQRYGVSFVGVGGGPFGDARPDPQTQRYTEAFELAAVGNGEAFNSAMQAMYISADELTHYNRASALRTLVLLEAAFGDEDRARAKLTQATEAFFAYYEWLREQQLDVRILIDPDPRKVLSDLVSLRSALGVGQDAEPDAQAFTAVINRHLEYLSTVTTRVQRVNTQLASIRILIRLGQEDQARRLIELVVTEFRDEPNGISPMNGLVSVAEALEPGQGPSIAWQLIDEHLRDGARLSAFRSLTEHYLLSDPEQWQQSVDAIDGRQTRASMYLEAAKLMGRMHRQRLHPD